MSTEGNIITDWLNKNSNPQIERQVELEAFELEKHYFALNFAYYIARNNYKQYSNGWANMFSKAKTTEELLIEFKNSIK